MKIEYLLVWYRRGIRSRFCHLTITNNSIAYTIAEWESRNRDTVVTHYMNSNNEVIEI